jgi:hypothetical protein
MREKASAFGFPIWRVLAVAGLVIALAAGIVLRLVWQEDIEFKADERWSLEQARAMLAGAPWPWTGMPTSVGGNNPYLSVWVFAALAGAVGADSGPALARAVQTLNAAALIAFALFAGFGVGTKARERCLWAVALWAVNPLAIIFERKIWPPSVLPLPAVIFIASWWFRHNSAAAFFWGLLGPLMAQIHLGAAFLAAAIALWTLIHDRGSFPWKGWVAGTVFGALPAIPWLLAMAADAGGSVTTRIRWPIASFFVRWLTQPFGLGIEYTLGRQDMIDYLAFPSVAGRASWMMGAVHVLLAALMVATIGRRMRDAMRGGSVCVRKTFLGSDPETVLIAGTLWGFGGLLTLLTVFGAGSHRHYMIYIAPIMMLWCVRMILGGEPASGRRTSHVLLVTLCIGQAIASAGLLHYIHETQIIRGEYGPSWRSQQSGPVTPGTSAR